jgi:hypothetical protein
MSLLSRPLSAAATMAARRPGAGHRLVRQLHLWIGAWGALAAILFGVTGLVQNHRALLKLPQGDATELSKVEIGVPEAARATPEALLAWLRDEHGLPLESVREQGGRPGELNGQKVRQPSRWLLSGGNARVQWLADYTPGNATLEVRNVRQDPLATALRLHKAAGGGVAWILLSDSFALAMVTLGISGLVLWARGRGPRQMVLSVAGVAALVLLLVGGWAVA